MRLEAISLGRGAPIGPRQFLTGIFKEPLAGPVLLAREGLAGDAICDRKHHGGVDQAVYLYFRSDYDYWTEQLQVDLPPGSFGENLTIAGFDATDLCVGDRFAIGDVVIEVTAQRTPCMTFALKMDDPHWVKRFFRAGRPGAYGRVLAPGPVEAGMAVTYQPYRGERIRVATLLALEASKDFDPDLIEKILSTPLSYRMREHYEERRGRLF